MNAGGVYAGREFTGFGQGTSRDIALDGTSGLCAETGEARGSGIDFGGVAAARPMPHRIVGHGMLTAACPGNVFSAPTPEQDLAAG